MRTNQTAEEPHQIKSPVIGTRLHSKHNGEGTQGGEERPPPFTAPPAGAGVLIEEEEEREVKAERCEGPPDSFGPGARAAARQPYAGVDRWTAGWWWRAFERADGWRSPVTSPHVPCERNRARRTRRQADATVAYCAVCLTRL